MGSFVLTLALLGAAATGLHLEAADLPSEAARELVLEIQQALERVAPTPVIVDAATPPRICESTTCVEALGAQLGVEELVLLRLYGGPRRIRVVVRRIGGRGGGGALTAIVEGDLPRRRRPADVDALVARLFRPRSAGSPPPIVERGPPPDGRPGTGTLPWILLAAGAGSAAAGVLLALDGADARDQLETRIHPDHEASSLTARRDAETIAASVLLGAAVVAVGAGVRFLVTP